MINTISHHKLLQYFSVLIFSRRCNLMLGSGTRAVIGQNCVRGLLRFILWVITNIWCKPTVSYLVYIIVAKGLIDHLGTKKINQLRCFSLNQSVRCCYIEPHWYHGWKLSALGKEDEDVFILRHKRSMKEEVVRGNEVSWGHMSAGLTLLNLW